jgi:hypothetical protein
MHMASRSHAPRWRRGEQEYRVALAPGLLPRRKLLDMSEERPLLRDPVSGLTAPLK